MTSIPVKLKPGASLLVPVFALLAACGGGNDSPADAKPVLLAEAVSQTTAAGHTASPADQITQLYRSLLGREPDPEGLQFWVQCLERGVLIGQIADTFKQSDEYIALHANDAARDPLKWPFSSSSIWNMPIGSNAQYAPANLSGTPGKNSPDANTRKNSIWAWMPGVDSEVIVFTPAAPMTDIYFNNAGWSGRNRCKPTGGAMFQVPMPDDLAIENSTSNVGAAFLMPDRRTIVQTQPLARCKGYGVATALVSSFPKVDLFSDGALGAHGGSGLSSVGGSIRIGELRPGTEIGPRHALKVNVFAREALFNCKAKSDCHRWPAVTSDSYATSNYGVDNGNANTEMKMGALLAIPASVNLASLNLKTAPARQLAWTLQNYGAYIVDDQGAAGVAFSAEDGPGGSLPNQFKADWGFAMGQKVVANSEWVHDMQKLVEALYVVKNNGPTSVGGGGTPLQALAPPIAP